MAFLDIAPAPEMDLETGLLIASLERGTQEWSGNLGEATLDQIVWQPFPDGHSIGALILHMAEVEGYWIEEVGAGKERTSEELALLMAEEIDQYGMQWPTPPRQPLEWYMERLGEVRIRSLETVRELSAAPRISRAGSNEFTLRWILSHVACHEALHGGQAALLKWMQEARTAQIRG